MKIVGIPMRSLILDVSNFKIALLKSRRHDRKSIAARA
jgi:hypothetical protein